MAQVPYTSFYNGPFAIYTSPTGMQSAVTNVPYLGGSLHEGDYCDLQASEAAVWNVLYGVNLYPGRYRLVRLGPNATAANLAKFGNPIGFGLGTSVAQAVVAAGGTGYTITATGASSGTVSISSSAAGGTAATASITLSAGVITSAQLTFPGANMTSVPTFTLTSVLSSGSGGSLLAAQYSSPNFVSSFDSSCSQLSTVRGVALGPNTSGTAITAAQITAGAWIVIQEEGIAPIYVTTATNTAAGAYAAATTGAAVTTTTAATAVPVGYFADTLDIATASATIRGILRIPVQQG
jgi:hypothetical protein